MQDDFDDDPPYSERDAGNVLNVLWLAIGLAAICAICGVWGWM